MSTISEKIKDGLILSQVQKEYFQRDGFLLLKNFINKDVCKFLINSANQLVDDYDVSGMKTIFSAKDQRHANDLYFLDSGDKISFFFEKNAFDEDGNLTVDKQLSINKIGHALHDLDPRFNLFSRQHKLAALVDDLGLKNALIIQSMYIFKQPHIGDEVDCHQDNTYLYASPQPVVGLWIALEDATLENGCLWAIPGGHRLGLKSRMLRDKNNRMTTEIYDDTPWQLDKMIPLEVPAGSVIVLHGLLPHMSKENKSNKSRHAYTLHMVSEDNKFATDNWLQRNDDLPFKGFL